MTDAFSTYFTALANAYRSGGTEYTGRTALENLLNSLKPGRITVQHEPGRQGDKGAPDYKITRKGRILGYVENKAMGENLDNVLKSDQIRRYTALSDNLIVTDYLQWIWLRDGKVVARETLGYESDLIGGSNSPADAKTAALQTMLDGFFSVDPEPVTSIEVLAEHLAARGQLLRGALTIELTRQEEARTTDRLIGLFGVFKDQVFHELTVKEFADAFAQMLAYSLFLAKLNAGQNTIVDLHNVKGYIPASFSLIRELSDFLDDIEQPAYADIAWVIDEILSLINGLDLAEIKNALSFQNRRVRRGIKARDEEEARLFERDPYIYFYEDFLRRYDPKTRETRGVYYTPPPVVNFIVRAIDDILKDTFNIKLGLADQTRVTVLDFACGTGTFLVEVLERIFDNIGGAESGAADLVIKDHVLENIYGFEFLLAPYTIAHLKLSQYLADKGHALVGGERLGIYLTNTLEPIEPQHQMFLPALSQEVEKAQEVKDKPILVITGNPPYSGHSKNTGKWISDAINAYKQVDGKPLGEKNPKWLNDDYVKFIRFSQMKMDGGTYDIKSKDGSVSTHTMEGVEEGIVGIITNHSFLDNPTFRGMRQSLMKSFDQIYVLDLHGNTKKREVSPDGSADMNVFDIQQGVAISIFIKTKTPLAASSPGSPSSSTPGSLSSSSGPPSSSSSGPPSSSSPGSPSSSSSGSPSSSSSGLTRGSTAQTIDNKYREPKDHEMDPRDKPEDDEGGKGLVKIFHASLWGKRLDKYKACAQETIASVDWQELDPISPFYLFIPQDRELWGEYEKGWKVTEVFPEHSLGTLTKRDRLSIDFSQETLIEKLQRFSRYGTPIDQIAEEFKLKLADKDAWNLESAIERARAIELDEIVKVEAFRPFENRFIAYDSKLVARLNTRVMQHFKNGKNLAIVTVRQLANTPFEHIFTSDKMSDQHYISTRTKEGGVVFPLYLYPDETDTRTENIDPKFRQWLDERYGHHFSPEQIMAYIYAVLHAPVYREKYAEFLRIDFPRIQFAQSRDDFEALATLGWDLMSAHLMREVPDLGLGTYHGKGTHEVEKPRYSASEQAVYINATKHFAPVPQDVWDFHIGGYQVIDKYLKSRKGRTLNLDEITNITNICNVVAFTIKQMKAIDDTYASAFSQ